VHEGTENAFPEYLRVAGIMVKGKVSTYDRPGRHRGTVDVLLNPVSTLALEGGGWGVRVNATPRPLYPLERTPVPVVQEVRWAPRDGLDGSGEEGILCQHKDSNPEPSSL
jgi:hypothetical protein